MGGVLGVFYAGIAIFTAPVIGATQLVIMVISGRIIASIVLAHFGLFGFEKNSLDWQQIFGLMLIVAGAVMISK